MAKVSNQRRRCANCGEPKLDVVNQPDPYEQEAHGDDTRIPLCTACVEALVDKLR